MFDRLSLIIVADQQCRLKTANMYTQYIPVMHCILNILSDSSHKNENCVIIVYLDLFQTHRFSTFCVTQECSLCEFDSMARNVCSFLVSCCASRSNIEQ